jgi:hypothetical protein
MSFWGGSAPAPDPNIGIAEKQMSDLSTEMWTTFKTDIYPTLLKQMEKENSRADEVWAMDKRASEFQLKNAMTDRSIYEDVGFSAGRKIIEDANKYNEAGYQEQMASQAVGDIASAQEVARQTQVNRDRAYGIDPTSGRSGAGFNANNVAAALAKAQAGTQTREAAKQLGLAKQAQVFNMAAGLPAQSLASSNSAVSSGTAGIDATGKALAGTTSASGALNSATSTAMGGWNNVGNLGVSKYKADLEKYSADSNASAGFGSMFGTLGAAAIKNPTGAAALFGSDINIKENVYQIGTLTNGFPLYAFEYKPEYRDTWGHGIQIGVMAQDVEPILPEAVTTHMDGYKLVDYDKVMNHGV